MRPLSPLRLSLSSLLGLCALLALAACDTTDDGDGGTRIDANNDTATTASGQPVTIDVLDNDEGDGLEITDFDAITDQGGLVTLTEDDELEYTPVNDFVGTDTFTYEITDDDGDTDEATVTVTVGGVGNTAPIANDNTAQTVEGQAVTIDVLANDLDPDDDTLAIASFQTPSDNGGTVEAVGDQLRYTPADGFNGTDTFTYVAEDEHGAVSDTAMVTVEVQAVGNSAPVASDDTAQVVAGETVTIDVLANDTDADGDDLDLAKVSSPSGGSFVRVNTETGAVEYLAPDDPGTYTFTYIVTDGEETDTATVTVEVK
jgi:hypothetical protein